MSSLPGRHPAGDVSHEPGNSQRRDCREFQTTALETAKSLTPSTDVSPRDVAMCARVLYTGVMIAIACGGFVFLLAIVVFVVVITVVLCRR